jgi:hypothetical protein
LVVRDNATRQDSAFHTNAPGSEVVWDGNDRFYVYRVGEMRIHYTDSTGDTRILRYTSDLDELGVNTDSKLAEMSELGEENWTWVHNSWFEIIDDQEPDYGEIYHGLDEAVERAIHLYNETLNDERKNK